MSSDADRKSGPWGSAAAVLGLGLLAALLNLAVARAVGPPLPHVTDEFGYLLIADTLAQGRLANPAVAVGELFQSPHVYPQPTYGSKFPPGQGLVLAAGQVLGHPFLGVCLSLGGMTAALYWMLLQAFRPVYAITGCAIAWTAIGPAGYFGQSYWGGAVATAAGALVVGGIVRMLRRDPGRVATAAALGTGTGMLALCRPFEGLLWLVVSAGFVLAATYREGSGKERIGTALLALVLAGPWLVFLGAYNRAQTGRVWLLPYAHYEATYDRSAYLVWHDDPPPSTPEMTPAQVRWREHVRASTRRIRELPAAELFALRFSFWRSTYVPGAIGLLVLAGLWFGWKRDRRLVGYAVAVALGMVATTGLSVFYQHHYFAAQAPVFYLLATLGVAGVHGAAGRRWRPWVAGGLGAGLVAAGILPGAAAYAKAVAEGPVFITWTLERRQLAQELAASAGGQPVLVLVDYADDYPVEHQWVYNDASLANPVLWGHWLGDARVPEIRAAFPGHRLYRLSLGREGGSRLVPLAAADGS